MAVRAPCKYPALLSAIMLAIFSTSVSAFVFGITQTSSVNGKDVENPRVDRIDKIPPNYNCYSVAQSEPIRSTDLPRVNEGAPRSVRAAVVANWVDTAQMDAVAFYTTPDCREDSKALIVRWYTNMDLPQIAYLAAGFTYNRIPRRLLAYKPIAIPPGLAPEEDYELARVDFETAILTNPGLMKPGSAFAPTTSSRSVPTYCEGLIRFAAFGDRSIRALGGISKEYFQNYPDSSAVPADLDLASWATLEGEIDNQLKQLITGVTASQGRATRSQSTYLPGNFGCNALRKEAYIDRRAVPSPAIEEEDEVVQHDEVILESDQPNPGQGNAEQKMIQEKQTTDTIFGIDDSSTLATTGQGLVPTISDSSESLREQFPMPSASQDQPQIGGRRGLRAKLRERQQKSAAARNSRANRNGRDTDEADVVPTKVQLTDGDQGVKVRRLGDNGSPNQAYEDLVASRARDPIYGPIDNLASRIGQAGGGFSIGDNNNGLEVLAGLIRGFQEKYFPASLTTPPARGMWAQDGNSEHPGIKIPIPRYPQALEEGPIQIPPLQGVQNNVDVSSEQPSEFLRDLNEIWLESGGREPPLPEPDQDASN
ncbi:hypothetical protein TWF718_004088 [Orbilia javanica]|uniref:Uncharacterized protein n=1 Tax=Orbilia javanica TaxID=47235 RepID=A0AAN8RF94_9PEZI